jgi:hypothetical protein
MWQNSELLAQGSPAKVFSRGNENCSRVSVGETGETRCPGGEWAVAQVRKTYHGGT